MKISKIEYENFRNFKKHGEIKCSTDGKVTIIYGKNGDGKTTLHQLFQWILYGQVHFNRTTTDRLYNLEFEKEQHFGDTFDVMGRIEFEHENEKYSVTRTQTYRKDPSDSVKILEDFSLQKMDEDNNWKRMDKPQEMIEKLLPSGLADYFFFDGESMIADLRVKGKDSATKLRKALFSMFDLDIIENALNHVGRIDLKTTVLGKLYISKATVASGSQIAAIKTNIENAQSKLDYYTTEITKKEAEKQSKSDFIKDISEKIGTTKSKSDYDARRKELKKDRDIFLSNASSAQSDFGDRVLDIFPFLLVSKTVTDGRERLHLKVEDSKLPTGIGKKLIQYLLKPETTECVCGNPLCEKEKEHIKKYLEILPPKSFAALYSDYIKQAETWSHIDYNNALEKYILQSLKNEEAAGECDTKITELDEEAKKSPDIEQLVIDRQKAEAAVKELETTVTNMKTDVKKFEIYLKKQMKEFDEQTAASDENKKVLYKIEVMQAVADHFKDRLEKASQEYSVLLESNIQSLLDEMLTSRRNVKVSPEFAVKVTDSYDDESKSEGQFAVVSFAYIGGILRMLQNDEKLSGKEYPLVLDGPFSKLDPDQRQNVVDTIPKFAPQVIIFSKDDLHGIIRDEHIGRVWTIVSNDEKNVARVEEGHLWK